MDLTYDEQTDTWRVDWERIELDNLDLDCLLTDSDDLGGYGDIACDYR